MDFFFLKSMLGLWFLTFLPGFVIIQKLNYQSTILRRVMVSFGLSLLFNYSLTFLFGITGLLSPIAYWIAGIILLSLLLLDIRKTTQSQQPSFLWSLTLSFGILLFLWILNQFIARSGSIPWGGDDLFGWNSWALSWYQGKPVWHQMNFYPQLLPITWATSYFFSGTSDIFFFSRSLMPYFFFGILLMGFDHWWQNRSFPSFGGLLGLFLLFIVWRDFPRMTMGLADIPAGFLAFSSFLVLLEAKKKTHPTPDLIIALLLATASSLTKQYGALYLAGFCILFIWFWQKEFKQSFINKPTIGITLGIVFVLLMSWYGVNFFVFNYHTALTNLFSTGAFEAYSHNVIISSKPSLSPIFSHALSLLINHFRSPILFVVMIIMAFLGTVIPPFGLVFVLITIPAFLFWGALVGYDIRNFSIGIVFLLYQGGVGFGFLFSLIKQKFPAGEKALSHLNLKIETITLWIKRNLFDYTKATITFFLTIGCFVFLGFAYPQEKLQSIQNERMKRYVGNHRDVNEMLYRYLEKFPESIVITDYPFIRYMPNIHFIETKFTNLYEIQNLVSRFPHGVFLIISGFPPTELSPEIQSYFLTNKLFKNHEHCDHGYLVEWHTKTAIDKTTR